MKTRTQRWPLLLSGCMELCWLFAWATFLTSSFFNKPFPLPGTMLYFFLGTALAVVFKDRGWRVVTVLSIQTAGLLLGVLWFLHYFFSGPYPFLGLHWVEVLFGSNPGFIGWISILFVLFCAVFVYARGARLGAKPTDHLTLCTQFDLGIAAFFALFFVHFVMESKGAVVMGGPVVQRMVVPFFLFSLLGIGLVRNRRNKRDRTFAAGSRGLWAIMGFSFVVLVFGTALILLFLPQLTKAAEIGFVGLKAVSAPFGHIFMGILQLMFRPKNLQGGNMGVPVQTETPDVPAGDGVWTERIMMASVWGLAVLLGLLILTVLLLSLWYLSRWLLSRTPRGRPVAWDSDPLLIWLRKKWDFLVFMGKSTALAFRSYKNADEIYAAFQKWGKRSGLTRLPQETPREYGNRMKGVLPQLEPQLAVIIDAFNEEAYGENRLDEVRLDKARRAMRRLRYPSLWFSRMKLLFFPGSPRGGVGTWHVAA